MTHAVWRDVALAPRTTLGVGGCAAELWSLDDVHEARSVVARARAQTRSIHVLGGGSNVVVSDEGLEGIVLSVTASRISVRPEPRRSGPALVIDAEGGASWDGVVARALEAGSPELARLSGIPGWVGAAPIQNIGAYGLELSDVLESVDVLDMASGVRTEWTRKQCAFGYRASQFKREPGRYLVLGLTLALSREASASPPWMHEQLAAALNERGIQTGDGWAVRETVLALRRAKGMLVDADDPDARSVGSFFVNPVVDRATYDRLRDASPSMPSWQADRGTHKLSAAWLIEHAGFSKGERRGLVGLSTKHALAIVARPGARAADVVAFAHELRQAVQARFGVTLEPEARLMGAHAAPWAHDRA